MGLTAACNQSGPTPAPAGARADCAKVAEILATLELGTGAKPQTRTASVARQREACLAANLTAVEATCIAAATDTWTAIGCAPRMFPQRAKGADCAAVAGKMRARIVSELPKDIGSAGLAMVERMLPVIETACREDNWPASYRECMLAAKVDDPAGFAACEDTLPRDLQLKLGERLKPIVRGSASAEAGAAGSAAQ